jgi:hypothetical protein
VFIKFKKALPWKPRYQSNGATFVLPIPIVLAYLVTLDVEVTGNITAKFCEVWSEFNIFAPWLPWQRSPF